MLADREARRAVRPGRPAPLADAWRDADAILLVPPFAGAERPSLAAHVLQACARAAGFRVRVLYANLWLAATLGVDAYVEIAEGTGVPWGTLAGERLFTRSAYGHDGLAERADVPALPPGSLRTLRALEARIPAWCDAVADAVARVQPTLVGATTTFEQTNASLALLGRIKRRTPSAITVLGGANCEGEMAEGIVSLDPQSRAVDYVFSGECEAAFPAFLRAIVRSESPVRRVLRGEPCPALDAIPTADFGEYFEQRSAFLPDADRRLERVLLPYETSRGCWWGEKHHCTFCGLNGEGMAFRHKSADRVIADLGDLAERHPGASVTMADNIMPRAYFRTLLPALEAASLPLRIFYEQKANLSLTQVLALKRAGVVTIQPGIEALSSDLLRRMRKGVSAGQNLALLRYARSAGVSLVWNLLCGFPGDAAHPYEETLALVGLIHHLQPPSTVGDLTIDRFSPYFERPHEHGLTSLRPAPAYAAALPERAAVDKVAYHFRADFPCALIERPDLVRALEDAVGRWQAAWRDGSGAAPSLRVGRTGSHLGHRHVLRDTRGLRGTRTHLPLEPWQVAAALTQRRFEPGDEATAWALERALGAVVDGRYVPLATADPELLLDLDARDRRHGAPAPAAGLDIIGSATVT